MIEIQTLLTPPVGEISQLTTHWDGQAEEASLYCHNGDKRHLLMTFPDKGDADQMLVWLMVFARQAVLNTVQIAGEQQARDFLSSRGYFVNVLWSERDIVEAAREKGVELTPADLAAIREDLQGQAINGDLIQLAISDIVQERRTEMIECIFQELGISTDEEEAQEEIADLVEQDWTSKHEAEKLVIEREEEFMKQTPDHQLYIGSYEIQYREQHNDFYLWDSATETAAYFLTLYAAVENIRN